MTFLASEQDPAVTGYLLAIVVNGVTGCPINFNFLVGDEYIKLETGHFANLGAEAFAAIAAIPAQCLETDVTTTLFLNGVSYNRSGHVLAISSIGSNADGNDTRVIINRTGGSLATTANFIGNVFGILYDDAEQPHSYTFSANCQRFSRLEDSFPRTSPRFGVVIPAGQTGWTKFWPTGNFGILGAVLVRNGNAGTSAGAFNSGHNLHKLKLTNDAYTMPIFAPGC
jgi:hypothetical protein